MADTAEFTIPGTKTKLPLIPVLGGAVVIAFVLLTRKTSGESDSTGVLSSEFNQRLQEQWDAMVNYLVEVKPPTSTPAPTTPTTPAKPSPENGADVVIPPGYPKPTLPIFSIKPQTIGDYLKKAGMTGSSTVDLKAIQGQYGSNPTVQTLLNSFGISMSNPTISGAINKYGYKETSPIPIAALISMYGAKPTIGTLLSGIGLNVSTPVGGGNSDLPLGSTSQPLSVMSPGGSSFHPSYGKN
jgi:hypothetical protein